MYFDIHINPSSDASSGIILIDNFDPRWREAIPRIMKPGVQGVLNSYAMTISRWSDRELRLTFSEENGLTHVHTQPRAALDLVIQGARAMYRSHNIHNPMEVCAVHAFMAHYIYWMNSALNDSKI